MKVLDRFEVSHVSVGSVLLVVVIATSFGAFRRAAVVDERATAEAMEEQETSGGAAAAQGAAAGPDGRGAGDVAAGADSAGSALAPLTPSDLRPAGRAAGPIAPMPTPESIRGLYVSGWAAGSARKLDQLLGIAERTEINAFVVDVKDVTGLLSYRSTIPLAERIGANGEPRVRDMEALVAGLRRRGIYPIARIVVFRDPLLASRRPDLAIQKADGSIWSDHHGEMWVDPYNRTVWDYFIGLAREAIEMGFSEVQWDYVRFPDVPREYMRTAVYPARNGPREEAIRAFLMESRERLADLGVPVTADVFGLTTSDAGDMGIGQNWLRMVDATDALLPMVYPSHYSRGSYGIAYPNGDPYRTVRTALEHAVRRTPEGGPDIRPWLQDFTLGQPRYEAAHVRAQIRAVYDAGLSSWILWNPSSNYTAAALASPDGRAPRLPIPVWSEELEEAEDDGLLGVPVPS